MVIASLSCGGYFFQRAPLMPSIITVLLTVLDKRPWGFWKMVSRVGALSPPLFVVWCDFTGRTCPWDCHVRWESHPQHKSFWDPPLLIFLWVSVTAPTPTLSHRSPDCFTPRTTDPPLSPHGDARASGLLCGGALLLHKQSGGKQGQSTAGCNRGQNEYCRYWSGAGELTSYLFDMSKLAAVINYSENRLVEKQLREMEMGNSICCHNLTAFIGNAAFIV